MAGLFNTAMCLRRTLDFQASDKDVWAIYYKSLTWFKAIFGGIPFPNHHLGWPTGGKGRYKLPRYIFWGSHPIMIPSLLLLRFSKWPDFWDGLFVQVDLNSRNWPNLFSDWLKQCVVCVCVCVFHLKFQWNIPSSLQTSHQNQGICHAFLSSKFKSSTDFLT